MVSFKSSAVSAKYAVAFATVSLLTAVSACTGSVATGDGPESTRGNGSTSGGGGSGGGAASDGVPIVTRVARLTHTQYDNTVRDLLGYDAEPAATFAPDAQNGFSFDDSIDLTVDGRLGPQYRAAAEEIAEAVSADSGFVSRFVNCSPGSAGCAEAFVGEFGKRAFRRPLTADEVTRFNALFARGSELVASGDAFRDGVRLVVEAALQSPQFLYRTELSSTVGANSLIQLDPWETASRLSYFLWNSMPSAELFAAAEAGELGSESQVEAAAALLLEDARAPEVVLSFHAQALRFAKFKKIAPDAATYPLAPAGMAQSVEEASRRFIQDVIVDFRGGIGELLSAPYAYADSGLAPLYGASVSGSDWQKISFEGDRAGLLMQAGFLASNAYAVRTDPIHRGLFVQRDLLCREIPDPPPGASMTPLPPLSDTIKTTRDQITALTSSSNCSGCHSTINAPGFAFESFDAVGQYRATDNDTPIDTTGTIEIDGQDVAFKNAVELVLALSKSAEVRSCYARKWLEYAFGRSYSELDQAQEQTLAQVTSTLELMTKVTSSKGFRFRAPNPVEQGDSP